ncbi:hypothetical protein PQX77_008787 [Marasmius sp. AFHP31]|nr:hypothetical protein PQX77_008787 [Marasmius sp. AFHP31]
MEELWPQNPQGRKDWMWKDLPPSSPPSDYDPVDHFSMKIGPGGVKSNSRGNRRVERSRDRAPREEANEAMPQEHPSTSTAVNSQANKRLVEEESLDSADEVDMQLRAPPSSEMHPIHGSELDVAILLGGVVNTTPQYDAILPKKLFSLTEASDPVKPTVPTTRMKKKQDRSTFVGKQLARSIRNQSARDYYMRNKEDLKERRKVKRQLEKQRLEMLSPGDRDALLASRRERQRIHSRNTRIRNKHGA